MSTIGLPSSSHAVDRRRLALIVAVVAITLVLGIVIGRATAPATTRPATGARPAAVQPRTAPARLVPDEAERLHLQVNRHMNELLAARR